MSQLQTKIIINGQDNASKAFKSATQSAMGLREGVKELTGTLTRFFGLSATVGSFTVFGKASLDAALNLDRLNKAFSTIEGSSARGAARLDYLREVSDKLGQNFYQTAEAAKGFFAAGAGTSVEGDLQKIFESVTEASTALGLSSSEYNRTLLALQQMISKGKVSAEELRQQLGEALPGAFHLFAQAAGVSTAQLDKMLERGEVGIDVLGKFADVLHTKYEKGATDAAQGLQAELNRLSTAWEDFKVSFMETDVATSSLQKLRGALEGATNVADNYDAALKAGGVALAAFVAQHKIMNSSLMQTHGSLPALAKSFLEVDSVQQRSLITHRALDTAYVREAQSAVNKAKAAQLAAIEAEKAAQSELDRVAIARQSAVTAKQVQTALEQESTALRGLYAAQTQTTATTQALAEAEKKLKDTAAQAAAGVEAAERQSLGLKKALQSESIKVAQAAVEEAKALQLSALAAEQAAQIKYNKAINSQDTARTRKGKKKAKSRAAEALEELLLAQKNTISTTEALNRAEIKFDETLKQSAGSIKKRSSAATVSLNMLQKAGLGVRSAFSGLLGIFGGPWGAAFTAAAGTMAYLSSQEAVAEKYAREHADALRLVSANTKEAGEALKLYSDRLNEMNKSSFELEGVNLKQQIEEQLSGNILEGGPATRIRAAFSDFWTSLEDAARLDKMTEILLPQNFVDATSEQLKLLKDDLQAYAVEKEKALEFKKAAQVLDTLISLKIQWEAYQEQVSKTRDATDSASSSTNLFARELAALDKAGGQFVTSTSDAIAWLDKYTANTELAKLSSEAFEKTQREVAVALLLSSAAVAAGSGQWETYNRMMDAAVEYQKRFAQVDAGKKGGGKSDAQRKAEAARNALEGYNKELKKLQSTDAEFRDWELENWVEEQIGLYPQYKEKIEEVAAARRKNWEDEDKAKAEQEARERSDVRLDFYQQLAEKSGQYNLSLEYANQLIDRQMEEWKNADIPQEYLDRMRELLRLEASTEGWDGAKRAMQSYYADATNMGKQFESFTQTSLSSLEDAFVDFTMTGKLSFSDLADSIIKDLVRIAYKAMVIAPIMQGITGMFGGGSLVSKALGASNAAVSAITSASGTPSARGNVFSGGSISDYSGSIVSSPTTFDFNEHLTAFRKGAGLMGEAGPEAVMPLTRGPGGILGVRSYTPDITMPAPQVTVNVINNTGQQVQAQTTATPDGQGGLNIEVVLDQLEAGMVQRDAAGRSRFANHLDRTRGLSRAGRLYR